MDIGELGNAITSWGGSHDCHLGYSKNLHFQTEQHRFRHENQIVFYCSFARLYFGFKKKKNAAMPDKNQE